LYGLGRKNLALSSHLTLGSFQIKTGRKRRKGGERAAVRIEVHRFLEKRERGSGQSVQGKDPCRPDDRKGKGGQVASSRSFH